MRPPPAFQCYASDWLAKEEFRLMTLDERGLLFSMLCQIWVSGSLPREAEGLGRLLGTDSAATKRALTPDVLKSFQPNADGRLACPELDALRAEYEARKRERSNSGRKGAEAKWHKSRKPTAETMAEPMAEPSALAMATSEVRRAEVRRGELKGNAPSARGLSEEHQVWVQDLDAQNSEQAYRAASRGK